jgi:hypothetical protein
MPTAAQNTMGVSPVVTDFTHVLRTFESIVPCRTPEGLFNSQIPPTRKHIRMGIGYYDNVSAKIESESYTFDSGDAVGNGPNDLCSVDVLTTNANIDPEAVWETAFDSVKELFDRTKDESAAPPGTQIPYYLKLDRVQAMLDRDAPKSIRFTVGIYTDPERTKIKQGYEMLFLDSAGMLQRANDLQRMQGELAIREERILGTHASQADLSPEDLAKNQADAATEKASYEVQIARHQGALVGTLASVLALPAVGLAFKNVTEAAFNEFKLKLPTWSQLDIPTLMTYFPDAMARIAAA